MHQIPERHLTGFAFTELMFTVVTLHKTRLLSALHIYDTIIKFSIFFLGYTKTEAGYLVAVSAVLDLIGRLGLGYLSDLQIFDRKKVYIVS